MTPIRLLLGFSPGSASDEIARLVVPAFARELGTRVDIVLRPGNNGADAAADVATSDADGGTLFMATLGTHALAPHLDKALPYDPVQHFAPVSLVATAPMLLACHPSVAARDARELIDLARASPRALTYGTSAMGGAPHLAAELFQHMAGIELAHVRYAQTERLYEDLEAGRLSLSFNNMMSMLPRCRKGALRALAVTGATRTNAAEDVPTVAENALPGYEMSNWVGIVAPKATPDPVIRKLSAAVSEALKHPVIRSSFAAAGVQPRGGTPEEFAAFMQKEIARWGPVVARFRDVDA